MPLVMSERQGLEIDYCPQCHGIWLDRGELDKLIEKSNSAENQQDFRAGSPQQQQPLPPSSSYDKQRDQAYYNRHKRKNWLYELFD
ncbi:MAG: zf-TFIIB domain-containing protein [Lutibacter sp.]